MGETKTISQRTLSIGRINVLQLFTRQNGGRINQQKARSPRHLHGLEVGASTFNQSFDDVSLAQGRVFNVARERCILCVNDCMEQLPFVFEVMVERSTCDFCRLHEIRRCCLAIAMGNKTRARRSDQG